MKTQIKALAIVLVVMCAWTSAQAVNTRASAPQSVTLTVYDTGAALVRELRRVRLASGENRIIFSGLPAKLDPATVSFSLAAGVSGVEVMEQQFLYDLAEASRMFQRYTGRSIEVKQSGKTYEGTLIAPPGGEDGSGVSGPLALRTSDGSALLFPDIDRLDGVTFPGADSIAFIEPTLVSRVTVRDEGLRNVRLNYATEGVSWSASYEMILTSDNRHGDLSGRVQVSNKSGGSFEDARVRLISTERGVGKAARAKGVTARAQRREPESMRYAYGNKDPAFERRIAGLAPLNTFDLPQPITLDPGQKKYVRLFRTVNMPVRRFYVYDGVKFDRFQRNRRSDWNYGVESHHVVESHLEFENARKGGPGMDLVPGMFHLYERRDDGSVDLVGEEFLQAIPQGSSGHVRLGVARGLRGERERTGYNEVVPLHEYEETFEIRLENSSTEEAEIRVVEHLYRWHEFEIVRADTEYTQTGPRRLEFRTKLNPAGRRSIHYTVRYSW